MAGLPERYRRSRLLKAATQNFSQELAWTIAFDGKALGHIDIAAPSQGNFYGDVGVELIPLGSTVIAFGHPGAGFERWIATNRCTVRWRW
jgi:hypothetical protein